MQAIDLEGLGIQQAVSAHEFPEGLFLLLACKAKDERKLGKVTNVLNVLQDVLQPGC